MGKKFAENSYVYRGHDATSEIESFIQKNCHGFVIGYRTPDNKGEFTELLIIAHYDVDFINNPKVTKYWMNRLLQVAAKFKDKIHIAIVCKENTT